MGVQRAEVSFRDKEARVTFDPARVSLAQLIQAVKDAGFHASLKGGGQKTTGAAPRQVDLWITAPKVQSVVSRKGTRR